MIAREGSVPLSVATVVAVGASIQGNVPWALAAWLVVTVLAYVFFEPARRVPASPLGMVSPVAGVAVRIGRTRDPWLKREAIQMRVKLSLPGVTALFSPTEGKVVNYWTEAKPFDGPPTVASATGSPNCYAIQVRTDEDDDVVFSVSSTRPISRFRLYVAPGERVGQGQRHGFAYFASFVDVLAPVGTRPAVEVGDRIQAGSTVLAHLIHD